MPYTLLAYVYTGLTVICVLLEEQLVCALPEEQTITCECSPLQLHIITKLAALPAQIHASILVVRVVQTQVTDAMFKAVHVQLSLPPPIVNETG